MIIENWTDDYVKFSDGSEITYDHKQDCCEYNYADFSVLDIFYNGEEFSDYRLELVKYGANLVLIRDANHKYGWSLNNKTIYIPFYSEQNGYYTDDVCLVVKGKSEVIIGPSEGYCILEYNDFTEKNVKHEIDSGDLDRCNAIFCSVCKSVMLCKTIADLDRTLEYHMHKEHTKFVMNDNPTATAPVLSRSSFSKKVVPLTAKRLATKGLCRYYLIEEKTQNDDGSIETVTKEHE